MCAYQYHTVIFLHTAPWQAPKDVMVEVEGPHTVNITWLPPPSQHNGVIRLYLVNVSRIGSAGQLTYNSSSTFLLLADLVAYNTYLVRVAAVTIAPGPYSETVHAATPEAGKQSHNRDIVSQMKH